MMPPFVATSGSLPKGGGGRSPVELPGHSGDNGQKDFLRKGEKPCYLLWEWLSFSILSRRRW